MAKGPNSPKRNSSRGTRGEVVDTPTTSTVPADDAEITATESEAPLSSVPPSTAALNAALSSELPNGSTVGARGVVIPAEPPVPQLDSLSEYSIETGPNLRDDVYRRERTNAGSEVYERLTAPKAQPQPAGPPGGTVPLTTPLPSPSPPPLDSDAGDTDVSARLSLDDLDSRPPTIPSAAAVAGPAGVPEALSHVGSEAYEGDVIAGRYRVDGVLGEGGMGIVYRCTDLTNHEIVALKRVIVPETDHAEEYIMWFYKEARALAALDHPGIVGARDFGRLRDGSPFLTMDLAPGVSLHDLSHAGLKWPTVWHIVDQILGALAHAHARGIIHGDLKPSNVLVEEVHREPPLVHMLDFGLA